MMGTYANYIKKEVSAIGETKQILGANRLSVVVAGIQQKCNDNFQSKVSDITLKYIEIQTTRFLPLLDQVVKTVLWG